MKKFEIIAGTEEQVYTDLFRAEAVVEHDYGEENEMLFFIPRLPFILAAEVAEYQDRIAVLEAGGQGLSTDDRQEIAALQGRLAHLKDHPEYSGQEVLDNWADNVDWEHPVDY